MLRSGIVCGLAGTHTPAAASTIAPLAALGGSGGLLARTQLRGVASVAAGSLSMGATAARVTARLEASSYRTSSSRLAALASVDTLSATTGGYRPVVLAGHYSTDGRGDDDSEGGGGGGSRGAASSPVIEDDDDVDEEEDHVGQGDGLRSSPPLATSTGTGDGARRQLANQTPRVPDSVMVVPLYRRPIFPGVSTPLLLSSDEFSSAMTKFSRRSNNKYVGLFVVDGDKAKQSAPNPATDRREPEKVSFKEPPEFDRLNEVGVLGRFDETVKLGPVHGVLTQIHGLRRIRLLGRNDPLTEEYGQLVVDVEDVPNPPYDREDKEVRALAIEAVNWLRRIQELAPMHKRQIESTLLSIDIENPGEVADLAACFTTASAADLQRVIEAPDLKERLLRAVTLLQAEVDLALLQQKIQGKVEEEVAKSQRKFFLHQQLKFIKQELGIETDEKEGLVEKFSERIADKTLPAAALKVVEGEIKKLQSLDPSSSEYNVTRTYLDWLTVLPWNTHSKENLDLEHAQEVLDEDHYGLKDIKERILEFIAVGALRGTVQGKILCFVGPPGTGKTSVGKSIARALDRAFFRFSVGGMTDVAEIKGHRRTYVGAMPGKLIQCLKVTETSNPVVMVDEIDKMGRGWQGDPASALLEALDPSQNGTFLDHYLDVPYDLSQVLFVCTANVTDTIPGPLLDRMEVLRLSGYVLEEKMAIVDKYLIDLAYGETGLPAGAVELQDAAVRALIQDYCREAGVRNLQKHVEKIFRKVAYKLKKGDIEEGSTYTISPDKLVDLVGKPVFNSDRFYDVTPPGVVMGLAWTSMGGSTLYIESAAERLGSAGSGSDGGGGGNGSMSASGQLGDVMKESANLSYTFAKAFYSGLDFEGKEDDFFRTHKVHVHVPEGATPKDGPSAGITLTTALLSLATGRPALPDMAMTGEITLTGRILPIGGVKEKAIAAKRSAVKTIIFPKENRKDWDDLEDYIKEGLDARFASHYSEVYAIVFGDDHQ